MDPSSRFSRRLLGVLSARLPEAEFDELDDPRQKRGRRWKHGVLLGFAVVALACGGIGARLKGSALRLQQGCEFHGSSDE